VEIKTEAPKPEPVKAEVPPIKPEITYEEFEKVDLRAAKVLAAERVPKSGKLLKLTVEIDGERNHRGRHGKDYTPEEIVGKTIVVGRQPEAGEADGGSSPAGLLPPRQEERPHPPRVRPAAEDRREDPLIIATFSFLPQAVRGF